MTGHESLWQWLVYAAVISSVVLVAGLAAVRFCRPTALRLRVIQWVLVGCIVAPWLHMLSPARAVSIDLLDSSRVAERVQPESTTALDVPAVASTDSNVTVSTTARTAAIDAGALVAGSDAPVPELPLANFVNSTGTIDAENSHESTDGERPIEAGVPATWNWSPIQWGVVALYLGFVTIMTLFWLAGIWRRTRLGYRAQPASRDVQLALERIAGRREPRVRILLSDEIDGPITWGVLRPVIVLPRQIAADPSSPQLRWSIAHEWSHVERRDVGVLLLASAAQLVCFYQPLFWWFRRQLILCQDFIADSRAARESESPEDYAAFLVQLARTRLQLPFSASLGIADRKSRLFRRVKTLVGASEPVQPKCRPIATILLSLGALLVLFALSTIRLDAGDADKKNENAKSETIAEKGITTERASSSANEKKSASVSATATEEGVVSGRLVSAADGRAVANARVILRGPKYVKAESDVEGRFRFENIPAGNYELWAYKDDLATKKETISAEAAGDSEAGRFAPVQLTMSPGKQLRLQVVSEKTGQPLEGAKVRFGLPDRRIEVTAKDGSAVVKGLLAGEYNITVEAQGHARVRRNVDVSNVEAVTNLKVELAAGGSIQGVVTDESGRPLPSAQVRIHEAGSLVGFAGDAPKTDGNAVFQCDSLPLNAVIEVFVQLDDYLPQQRRVTLTAEQPDSKLEIRLEPRPVGGSIAGQIRDKSGKPVAGATVANYQDGLLKRKITSDAQGRYVFHDLHEGSTGYEIYVTAKQFAPQLQTVKPGTAATPATVDITLENGHFIRGRVVNRKGEPLQHANVWYGSGLQGFDDLVRTDKQGMFSFDSLPEKCPFNFTRKGYTTILRTELKLDLKEVVDVTMAPMGVIRGRVVDATTGKPVERFNVRVGFSPERRRDDPQGSFPNDLAKPGLNVNSKDGLFTLENLDNGVPLEMTVRADGYANKIFPRVAGVDAEKAEFVGVSLKKSEPVAYGSVKGQIVDAAGQPVRGANLRLIVSLKIPESEDDKDFSWMLIESNQLGDRSYCDQYLPSASNSEGRFEFANVLPGKYLQLAYWGDGVVQGRSLAFDKTKSGEAQDITIKLPKPAKIVALVDLEKFPDADQVTVTYNRGSWPDWKLPFNGDQRRFEFATMSAGEYIVRINSKLVRSKEDDRLASSRVLAEQKIQLKAGETQEIHFTEPGSRISGRRKDR